MIPAAPHAVRRDRVKQLVSGGLSYREAARVVGVSHTQVAKDLRPARVPQPTDPSIFGRRGVGNGNLSRGPLPQPTTARPGTPEKLAVLAHRAVAGNELWHPLDAV